MCLRYWCGNKTCFYLRLNRNRTLALVGDADAKWGPCSGEVFPIGYSYGFCITSSPRPKSFLTPLTMTKITVPFREQNPRESTTSPSKENKTQPTPRVWFTALLMITRQTTYPHHAPVSFVTQKHNNVQSYLVELFWAVIILYVYVCIEMHVLKSPFAS